MAQQNRPSSNEKAPDPARSYERAKPEAEAGMGRLSTPPRRPHESKDKQFNAVTNRQKPRQINNEDVVNAAGNAPPIPGVRADDDETERGTTGSAPQTRRGSSGQPNTPRKKNI